MAFDFKGNFGGAVAGWTTVSALNGELINYEGSNSYFVDTTGETDAPPDAVFKSFLYVAPGGAALNFQKTGLVPNELYDFYLYIWSNSGFWDGHTANVFVNGTNLGGYTYLSAVAGQSTLWGHGKVVKFSNVQANASGEFNVSVDPAGSDFVVVSGYRIKGLPDTAPPSKVTNLTVDANRVVTSNPATDNDTVTGYQTQYSDDSGTWIDFASSQRTFTDNVPRLTTVGDHMRKYRRRAFDAVPNYGEWSDVFTVNYAVLLPPTIQPMSGLFAQTNQPYQLQLKASGGSGNYIWSQIVGNLPGGALSASGLITIPVVGSSNYTFTARATEAANNSYDEESFTILVTPYPAITFCYARPLEEEEILKIRVFEPVEGDDETAEDAAPQYRFNLKAMYIGGINLNELRDFLTAHRRRQKFYWINPDLNNQALLVKRVDNYKANHALNYGGFEFMVQTVNGLNYV